MSFAKPPKVILNVYCWLVRTAIFLYQSMMLGKWWIMAQNLRNVARAAEKST